MEGIAIIASGLYPAYQSFKALEAPTQEKESEWLMYWVILGIFSALEYFLAFVFSIVPLYWLVRIAFFVWLQAPQTRGAHMLYSAYLKPLLVKHQDRIDDVLANGGKYASQRISGLVSKAKGQKKAQPDAKKKK